MLESMRTTIDDRLIRIASQASRTADLHFLRKPLDPEDWEEIAQTSPRLRGLNALREALRRECLMVHGMMKLAECDATTALKMRELLNQREPP